MSNPIDSFFKKANKLMDRADEVTAEVPEPDASEKQRHSDWEGTWEEPKWAPAGDRWHAFRQDQFTKAVCAKEFKPADVSSAVVLEHGKCIMACTSCIIGVSR